MLYKKYHRNFIRQFKKEVKFEYMYLDDSEENATYRTSHICCTGEPMIGRNRWDHTCCIQIPVSRDDYSFNLFSKFTLIFSDGIIEDVKLL